MTTSHGSGAGSYGCFAAPAMSVAAADRWYLVGGSLEATLGDSSAYFGGYDHREGQDEHDHGDRYHLWELAREAQGRVEVDREGQARADDERRDRVLVERRRERDQEGRDDCGQDQRQRDQPERLQRAGSEVGGRFLEVDVDLVEARNDDQDRVRQGDHDVADHHRQQRARDAERVEQQEQRDPEDDVGHHERAQEQRRDGVLAVEAATRQGQRSDHAERDRAEARQRGDDRACLERPAKVAVDEELVVPVQRESREREARDRRLVEREDQQDHDRRVEEDDDEREEDAQDASAVLREGRVHQFATWPLGRKRGKTTGSTATTPSRKSESTDPVSQSGKPVPNRSTIWLPYM